MEVRHMSSLQTVWGSACDRIHAEDVQFRMMSRQRPANKTEMRLPGLRRASVSRCV